MFYEKYEKLWEQVLLAAHNNNLSNIRICRTQDIFLNPEMASALLFHPEFGSGGKFDEMLINNSMLNKKEIYREQVYAIAPLYVSSICSEQCVYCNFRKSNDEFNIVRKRLDKSELTTECEYLIKEKGLHVIELVYASDPLITSDDICRDIETTKIILEKNGGGIVGLNAEVFEEYEYRNLRDSGMSFIILWQETYDQLRYREVHPGNSKKSNFQHRLEAYERMISAGIQHIGMGVLSGLSNWRYDWAMLFHHQSYLRNTYGHSISILGVPRMKPVKGAVVQQPTLIPTDQEFIASIALHNIFSPATLPFVNTREAWDTCLEMAAGGGALFTFNCSTIPGGHSLGSKGFQFPATSFDAVEYRDKITNAGFTPIFDWTFDALMN